MSCEKEKFISTTGVLRDFTGLGGCGFLIEVEDAGGTTNYQPTNLENFVPVPIDGRKIKFKFKSTNLSGTCMTGPIIELSSVKEKK